MPAAVFDGLADIFTDPNVFGEAVDYTPAETGVARRINAIWTERSGDVVLGGENVATDAATSTLGVRVADVVPAEDDVAVRVADGKRMLISTPILPDGKGMTLCNLVQPPA